MKKLLLSLIAITAGSVLAYDKVSIENSTPFRAKIIVKYMTCSGDEFFVEPYSTATAQSNRGGCLVQEIYASVTETKQGLDALGYGAMQANRENVQSRSYTSSGTSYSKFQLTGPIIQDNNERVYRVTRVVE